MLLCIKHSASTFVGVLQKLRTTDQYVTLHTLCYYAMLTCGEE